MRADWETSSLGVLKRKEGRRRKLFGAIMEVLTQSPWNLGFYSDEMSTRSGRGLLFILAIHAVNEYHRLPWKPPVTAALVAVNSIIHLRPRFLLHLIPPLDRVSFNSYIILKHRDVIRLLLSPFYHVGDTHLFYNMVSLLWKGVRLECSMGSLNFASMVATLLVLSQLATILLSKAMVYLSYDRPFFYEYSVGFSGVLFAMKVVLNSMSSEHDITYVSGIAVPVKYAAWAELILLQMFVPDVSFWGHLGGLLAGVVYVKLKQLCSASDPLCFAARCAAEAIVSPLKLARWLLGLRWRGRGRVSGGGSPRSDEVAQWSCGACTFINSGWLNACEMCGTGRSGSVASPQFRRSEPTADEIRRRRMERFER